MVQVNRKGAHMPPRINEGSFEYYILDELLDSLGYQAVKGVGIAPHEPLAERESLL